MTLKEFTIEQVAKGLYDAANVAKAKRMNCKRVGCPWEELFGEAKAHCCAMAEYALELFTPFVERRNEGANEK